jgi:hypothetical protein
VWTPKRILILVAGLVSFLFVYGVYVFFLGVYDGLPQLPKDFKPGPPPDIAKQPVEDRIEKKLRDAFGVGCPELKRSIQLDLPKKGWGLAANHFDPEPDGRIKLTPFSAFMIPKSKDKSAKTLEINTIRCDIAYLTLDRKISNMAELGNRKVIAVELCRDPAKPRPKDDKTPDITITNNRGTPEITNDDVELYITDGRLLFEEAKHLIWTDGRVRVNDLKDGNDITSQGMKMYLSKDTGAAPGKAKTAAKAKANKGETVTGVENLILLSRVNMELFVDSRSGFLGGMEKPTNPGPSTSAKEIKAPELSHLNITHNPGGNCSFTYDLIKDLAWFDSIPAADNDSLRSRVQVLREHKSPDGKNLTPDKILCDRLELQFRRKTDEAPAAGSDGQSINKEIESAHATARSGAMVDLDMTTDMLHAWSEELEFFCATPERGPKVTLKGKVKAVKEGHVLHAQQVVLIGADKNGNGQQAIAKGPGQVDLYDKSAPKDAAEIRKFPWKAVFKDSLTTTKDKVGNKVLDLLTLTGDAAIIDEEHKEALQAQRLLIWLEPDNPEKANPPPSKENASGAPRQKPKKVEAFDRVKMVAPDMNIRQAEHLTIYFTDEPAPFDRLPATNPDNATTPPLGAPLGGSGKSSAPAAQTAQNPPEKDAKQKQPIDLDARDVVAYITRSGTQNYLRELVTEGDVHVNQKGNTPQDKGVDIKGDMLNLLHNPLGDTLYVFGDLKKPAQLQLGELILAGPKVTINQKDNMAEVEGIGFMEMRSNAAFDGGKPAKPGTRLTVHWNKDMLFDGKHAEFHGGVIAYQDNASLRSQNLEVTLDRAVSFKEGQKGAQNAKVEILVCDGKVFIVDEKKDDKGNREAYHRLEVPQLRMDNAEETVHTSGPGRVIIISKGSEDLTPGGPRTPTGAPGQAKTKSPAKGQEFQLTRIDFLSSMHSNNQDKQRTSKFYDNVQIYHAPGDRPDAKMDPDHPPKGGFYMRCEILIVYTLKTGKDKTSQIMQANNKVTFRTQEFFGNAATAQYYENKEVMIFEGAPGNPARLYQFVPGTNQTREIVGMKILHNRRTGAITVQDATGISGN